MTFLFYRTKKKPSPLPQARGGGYERGDGMNRKRLLERIYLLGFTEFDLANYLGISLKTLEQKLDVIEGEDFTQVEIQMIVDRYNLSIQDVKEMFFDDKMYEKRIKNV